MSTAPAHSVGPRRSTWTHIALCVKDIEASIAWYERHTHLKLLQSGEDKDGKNAWLGDDTQLESPFVLVLGQFYEGHDPFAPAPHPPMGPFALFPLLVTVLALSAVAWVATLRHLRAALALRPIQALRG